MIPLLSINALSAEQQLENQRVALAASASATLRSDIQWGIVRGLFMYMLLTLPIWIVIGIAYALLTAR
jgi:hypothetical protein